VFALLLLLLLLFVAVVLRVVADFVAIDYNACLYKTCTSALKEATEDITSMSYVVAYMYAHLNITISCFIF
jgi:hypothetical protein